MIYKEDFLAKFDTVCKAVTREHRANRVKMWHNQNVTTSELLPYENKAFLSLVSFGLSVLKISKEQHK